MSRERGLGLTVVGATAAPGPEELPQFLDPICADEDSNEYFIAHVSPWDQSAPQLQPLNRETFEAECEAGYWQHFEARQPFRWDYRLVALQEGELATYLQAELAYARVRELGVKALEQANEKLAANEPADVIKKLTWYATRAIPEDPFPLLVSIALGRAALSDDVIEDLITELPDRTTDSPLLKRARHDNWSELISLIASDPVGKKFLVHSEESSTRSPWFLEGIRDQPTFLGDFQYFYGLVSGHA